MARIRTHEMTEREVESLLSLDHGEATREGDYFLAEIKRFGDDFPHYLRLPLRRELEDSSTLYSPFTAVPDYSGALQEMLGNVFEGCHLSSLFYREVPGEKRDELPVYEVAELYDAYTTATHLMVQVLWPLDRPPAPDLNMNSDFARTFKAVAQHCDPTENDDTHGTDLWVFDVSAFDADYLERVWADHDLAEVMLEENWSLFELHRPYYRRQIEALSQEITLDFLSIEMEEDHAAVTLYEMREAQPGQKPKIKTSSEIWYDQRGLDFIKQLITIDVAYDIATMLARLGRV